MGWHSCLLPGMLLFPSHLRGKCLLIPQEAVPVPCISCSFLSHPLELLGGIASSFVFSWCIALHYKYLFYLPPLWVCTHERILIMLNLINIHSFFVSMAPSKSEVHSSFMINVYCSVPSFCALDCVLHPSNGITYYYIYDIVQYSRYWCRGYQVELFVIVPQLLGYQPILSSIISEEWIKHIWFHSFMIFLIHLRYIYQTYFTSDTQRGYSLNIKYHVIQLKLYIF